jgi:NAD(P)-dependent dehydrogenase (short-subunit alcohol dehydrogenase family)
MHNNAGICLGAPLVDTPDEMSLNTIAVDLNSVYWGLKFSGRAMLKQRSDLLKNFGLSLFSRYSRSYRLPPPQTLKVGSRLPCFGV